MGDGLPAKALVRDLPNCTARGPRTLAISPTGKLYIGAPEAAGLLRMTLDGLKRTVFATGLADPMAFGWHPETLSMFGWDQQELNLLLDSHDYSPGGEDAKKAEIRYKPHAAPAQMVFYAANELPVQFRNDLFVTMYGASPKGGAPEGFEVVRVRFAAGRPAEVEPFLTGFLAPRGDAWSYSGRPFGIAVHKDGSLLVGDAANGIIYRITYGTAVSQR